LDKLQTLRQPVDLSFSQHRKGAAQRLS
jgi:hypothetical protein